MICTKFKQHKYEHSGSFIHIYIYNAYLNSNGCLCIHARVYQKNHRSDTFKIMSQPCDWVQNCRHCARLLQNEDLSFFQWPLRGALFPLKGLGILTRRETSKLKHKLVLLCRRYRPKIVAVTCCALITCEVFVSLEITSVEQ